jgi:hypothetical protein
LKIQLLSRGMEMSNSKPGRRVSALHLFVEYIPPMVLDLDIELNQIGAFFSFLFQD